MPPYPGFISGSGAVSSVIADQQQTMNLYVEPLQSPSVKNTGALFPTPGFQVFVDASSGITDVDCRALWADLVSGVERCMAVIGGGLYEVNDNRTVVHRGDLAQDSYQATINYNGAIGGQLFITSGSNGYNYDLSTNTLTQVLAGDATMGAFSHGYFLAFNITTGRVRLSNLNDGTIWDAGTFFQRSLFSDPWQAMFSDPNSLIWLPGTKSFEVWHDTGTGTQPFAPLSGLVGPYGIAAPFAFGLAGPMIHFLSKTTEGAGTIVSLRGGTAEPEATYAVNHAITGYLRTSRISDAEALIYQEAGHTFANFSFPTANATWTYDTDAPSWAERGVWNSPLGRFDLWAPRTHCLAFGKHLVGDRSSGTIAEMSTSFATEFDGVTGIRRLRRAPGLTQEHARTRYDRFELLMDVGLGTVDGPGVDPTVMLRTSDDGGRTWSNERIASMGRMGEWRRRVYWNRLGSGADRVFEVSFSDPVPFRITQAWVNNQNSEAA